MARNRVIITALVTLVGIGGIISGAMLLKRNTELREKAAVPGGRASVTLTPTSGSFDIGDTFLVSVFFNTDGVAVSGVAVRVTYPFSGATPEVTAADVSVNPTLLGTGDWSCPTNNVTAAGGNVNIDVACANLSATGFSSTTDTLLATFNLTVIQVPEMVPFTIKFDPANSVITQKSNGQDILGLPTTIGNYAMGGTSFTPTPTTVVTTGSPTPTTKLSGTPTPTKKVTPTATKSATITATGGGQLPDAGVSLPTLVGLGIGILAIFGSLALAL